MYINDVLGSSKDISNERFLISEEIGLESLFLHVLFLCGLCGESLISILMGALCGFDDPQTLRTSDDSTFMSVHFLHFQKDSVLLVPFLRGLSLKSMKNNSLLSLGLKPPKPDIFKAKCVNSIST